MALTKRVSGTREKSGDSLMTERGHSGTLVASMTCDRASPMQRLKDNGSGPSEPGRPADRGASKPDETAGQGAPSDRDRPREVGGRGGLDPVRYGDWERAGRCIDF